MRDFPQFQILQKFIMRGEARDCQSGNPIQKPKLQQIGSKEYETR
jgi:hypothetical protein